jgi:hypothetical protein
MKRTAYTPRIVHLSFFSARLFRDVAQMIGARRMHASFRLQYSNHGSFARLEILLPLSLSALPPISTPLRPSEVNASSDTYHQ